MNILKLAVVSIFVGGSLFAGTYSVDRAHSHVGFKVKHMMISNVKGEFNVFSGVIEYDEKIKKITAIDGKIDVHSINTANKKRDGHLKSAELFDAKTYPEITYTLNKIEDDTAYGILSMRGISKEISMDLENNGTVIDPWGNQRIGLALSGKINRKDFGITWNQVLEAGGVAVGEIVELDIEVEGILAK